jgi:hypothetical protein
MSGMDRYAHRRPVVDRLHEEESCNSDYNERPHDAATPELRSPVVPVKRTMWTFIPLVAYDSLVNAVKAVRRPTTS